MVFSSCLLSTGKEIKQHTDKIKSISISTNGGDMGFSQTLKITADSLYFDFNLAVNAAKKRKQRKSNTFFKLEDIIGATQLINFSKTINGASRQPVDGTDTEIIIITEHHKYSVINGEEDNNWNRIKELLYAIINKEFKVE